MKKPKNLPHRKFGGDPKARYREWLVETVNRTGAERVAEVGVFAGRTTRRLAEETSATIWAVDHWEGVPGDPLQAGIYRQMKKTEALFRKTLAPWIKDGRVIVQKMDSLTAAQDFHHENGRTLDLCFLDADHSYEGVREDIWAWQKVVRPGGILAGHDLNWPGVRDAVVESVPNWQPCAGGFAWWTEISE